MKMRSSAVMALILSLTLASPVLADCCDSVFDCAASVVTDGLSCVIQEIISTVKNLVTLVADLVASNSSATQKAASDAQAQIDAEVLQMSQEAELSNTKLAAALDQANKILQQEGSIVNVAQRATGTPAADVAAAASPSTPKAPAPATAAKPASAQPAKQATATIALHPAPVATAAAPQPSSGASNTAQKVSTTTPPTAVTVTSPLSPPGGLRGLFENSVKEIQSLKATGDPDAKKVLDAMPHAKDGQQPRIQAALAVADNAINQPLRDMLGTLNGLLANPTHIFDPSDIVNQLTSSVLASLDANLGQMVDSITAHPQVVFDNVGPAHDELVANADHAQKIAAAMQTAYTQRTQASRDALGALLPFPAVASGSNTRARSVAGSNLSLYATMASAARAKKGQIVATSKQKISGIAPLAAQFKAVKAKALAAKAAVPTYQANFSRQLNAAMAGKTQAQMDAQRDQLIAQARSRFASDPTTRDAVIRLLQTESGKIKPVPKH